MRWRRPTLLEIEFAALSVVILISIGQMVRSGLSYMG